MPFYIYSLQNFHKPNLFYSFCILNYIVYWKHKLSKDQQPLTRTTKYRLLLSDINAKGEKDRTSFGHFVFWYFGCYFILVVICFWLLFDLCVNQIKTLYDILEYDILSHFGSYLLMLFWLSFWFLCLNQIKGEKYDMIGHFGSYLNIWHFGSNHYGCYYLFYVWTKFKERNIWHCGHFGFYLLMLFANQETNIWHFGHFSCYWFWLVIVLWLNQINGKKYWMVVGNAWTKNWILESIG